MIYPQRTQEPSSLYNYSRINVSVSDAYSIPSHLSLEALLSLKAAQNFSVTKKLLQLRD